MAKVPPVPVTLPSIWVSVSATKSVAATAMLKLPSDSNVPVTVLLLTTNVTTSPVANLPVTLPVTAMLPVFSAALIMLSVVIVSIDKAVVLSAVESLSTV